MSAQVLEGKLVIDRRADGDIDALSGIMQTTPTGASLYLSGSSSSGASSSSSYFWGMVTEHSGTGGGSFEAKGSRGGNKCELQLERVTASAEAQASNHTRPVPARTDTPPRAKARPNIADAGAASTHAAGGAAAGSNRPDVASAQPSAPAPPVAFGPAFKAGSARAAGAAPTNTADSTLQESRSEIPLKQSTPTAFGPASRTRSSRATGATPQASYAASVPARAAPTQSAAPVEQHPSPTPVDTAANTPQPASPTGRVAPSPPPSASSVPPPYPGSAGALTQQPVADPVAGARVEAQRLRLKDKFAPRTGDAAAGEMFLGNDRDILAFSNEMASAPHFARRLSGKAISVIILSMSASRVALVRRIGILRNMRAGNFCAQTLTYRFLQMPLCPIPVMEPLGFPGAT